MTQGPGEAVYEMFWDCKYCGQTKLLGLTHRFCAKCGAPQDPAARYFPADHEKVPVHAHPFVGADVACPACRQPMSRSATCCTNCGSPIDRGAEVQRRADVVVPDGGGQPFGAPPFAAGVSPFSPTPMGMAAAHAPPKKSVVGIVLGVIGGVVALLVLLVLVAAFWKREGVFEVTGHSWQRDIAVERYETATRTAWCSDRPVGARELSRRREQRSSTRVKDGETCQTRKKDNGNGTFSEKRECTPKYRDEPVYDDRCTYEVTEWHTTRTLTEKGASPTDPPRWPNVTTLRTCPITIVGCEREGARAEAYKVAFIDRKAGKDASCSLPEPKWAAFAKGSTWKGKVGVMTGIVDCDELVKH